MPILKTQEIKCLECEEVLHPIMGERTTLVCSCAAVKVNVYSNYISTETLTDNYEMGEIEEIDSSYIPLIPNPVDRPLNEEKIDRIWGLLRESVQRVGELEWELKRLVKLVDEIR